MDPISHPGVLILSASHHPIGAPVLAVSNYFCIGDKPDTSAIRNRCDVRCFKWNHTRHRCVGKEEARITMHSFVITTFVLLFLTHIGTVFAQSGDKLAPPLPLSSSAFVDVKASGVTARPANGKWPGTRLFYSDAS